MQELVSFPGIVYSLGREAAAACMLYAQLTGRKHEVVESIDQLTALSNAVVVCTTARLTAALMHHLFVSSDCASAPGLISAGTTADLEYVCRQQAARLVLRCSSVPRRIFIYQPLAFEAIQRDTDTFVAGTLSRDAMLPLLSADADVLSIFGNSNGVDLALSARQFACPVLDAPEDDADLLPPCQSRGVCMMFPAQPKISDARNAGWIIPLSSLRARIGIIAGCRVMKLQDGQIDAAHGFATSLLRHAHFSVLITTWRSEIFAGPAEINSLINDLSEGVAVGDAVQRFNTSELAMHIGTRLCIIGDPCFSLPRKNVFPRLPIQELKENKVASVTPNGPENAIIAEAHLLRAAVKGALQRGRFFDPTKGESLVTALNAYEKAQEATAATGLATLDSLLIDFLGAHPLLAKFFSSHAKMGIIQEDGVCPSCSAPARRLTITFPEFGAQPRHILRCAYCDDSSVLPADWNTRLDLSRLSEGWISISEVPDGAKVLLSVLSIWGLPAQVYSWEPVNERRPPFRLPQELPRVPLDCEVLIAHRCLIGSLGFKVRRKMSGEYSMVSGSTDREILPQTP